MARIRSIKPEIWTSEQFVELSPITRLLFIGMWNFCDDRGIHPASFKSLKMQIFPGDDDITISQIEKSINEIMAQGLIIEYTEDSRKYWIVTGWHHQKIDRPNNKYLSSIKDISTIIRRSFDDQTPEERIGEDRRGKEGREGKENFTQKINNLLGEFPIEDFIEEIKSDEEWTMTVCSALNISKENAKIEIGNFLKIQAAAKKFYKTSNDCRAHFMNTYLKNQKHGANSKIRKSTKSEAESAGGFTEDDRRDAVKLSL